MLLLLLLIRRYPLSQSQAAAMVDGWSMVDARCDADAMMVHAAWNSNVYLSVDGGDPLE